MLGRSLFVAASAALAAGQSTWLTEHHDIRNSGQADVVGPGERNGTCASDIIDGSSLESSAMYYSTGVLSNTNEYLFIGNTFNLLQVVEVESFNFTSVNLTVLSPGAPVTGWGVVASAANHKVIIGSAQPATVAEPTFIYADRVYVPSADGNLYAIQPQYCASQLAVQRARSVLAQSPSDPSVHRPDADLARSLYGAEEAVGAITCAAWIKSFTQPLYAPTRWVPSSPAYPANGDGVVLVSETDPQLDTHGVMHALDSITGATLWSMNAEYVDSTGATVTAGLRVVPAVNPTLTPAGTGNQTYVGFMAFGTRVVAFDVYTGAILADINNNAITAASPTGPGQTDIFVSSPTLTADGSTLFVHSSTGTLWKIAVGGAYPAVTLTFVWACDYYIKGKSPLCDNVTLPLLSATATTAAADAAPLDGAATWTRRRALAADNSAAAAAAEIVNGGFYQPTTRQQRSDLYAAIAAEHARLFTAAGDVAAAVKAAQEQVHTADSITPLLRALPYESVAALSTASGYRLLAPDSVPVGAKLQRIAALAEQAAATRKQSVQSAAAGIDTHQLAGLTGAQRRQLRAVLAAATATPASAAADAASRYGFLGVFPFATPSLMPGDAAVIVAQYGFMGGDNGIFSIKPADGSQNWGLQNITSPVDGKVTTFGHSRSSPAIDPSGNVYVGTDSDDGIYTLPLLLAISPAGAYTWLTGIDTDNVVVGSASPIVGQGFKGEKRAYMVSGYGITAFDEGYACPGALDPFSACSGNGVCDCTSGTCTCSNQCFTGPDCSVALTCSGHGTCDGDLGCQCDPCWAGDDCSIPMPCQHGTCSAGVCVCQACWTGMYCEAVQTCNGHGHCSPFTNKCACDRCTSGAFCDVPNTCNGHGACNSTTGACACSANYNPATACQTCDLCHAGQYSGCNQLLTDCSGNGACVPTTGACACNAGWAGANCDSKAGGSNGGAVAAGILIPTIVVGAAASLWFWKRKNPGKPFRALLPSWAPGSGAGGGGGASSSAGSTGKYTKLTWGGRDAQASAMRSNLMASSGSGSKGAGGSGASSSGGGPGTYSSGFQSQGYGT